MLKAFAETGSPSTTRTADDRADTEWANTQAANAGVRNPARYVRNNVRNNSAPVSRNRVVGQTVNRNRG